jgi:glucose-6-phosphate 1-dehydrogenase
VPGYREETGVPADSTTETFAALCLEIANWRWAGVPFYLRTGKRLARELTEVAVTLKPVPQLALVQEGSVGARPNQLVLGIDPDEGASAAGGGEDTRTANAVRPVKMGSSREPHSRSSPRTRTSG